MYALEFDLDPSPLSYVSVPCIWVGWLLWLRRKPVSYETARKYFSALKSQVESFGVDLPFYQMPILCSLRKAWRRLKRDQKKKVPITQEQVDRVFGNPEFDLVFGAIVRFGFETLARIAEIHAIRWSDITFFAEYVLFRLQRSKTDPFGERNQTLTISRSSWEAISSVIPPCESPRSRIFPFDASKFRKWISVTLSGGITGHSLRRGGAQRMWDQGFSEQAIMEKGRWRSNAWLRYVDRSARQIIL